MPLTKKGRKIKAAMVRQYGAKKGKQVFYASERKGTIKGVKIPGGSTHELIEMGPETESKMYDCPPDYSMTESVKKFAKLADQDTHPEHFEKRPGNPDISNKKKY